MVTTDHRKMIDKYRRFGKKIKKVFLMYLQLELDKSVLKIAEFGLIRLIINYYIQRMIVPENQQNSSKSIKIRHFTYGQHRSNTPPKFIKVNGMEPNPIKVVVDMMGEDGIIHQKIIKQNYELQHRRVKQQYKSKKTAQKKQAIQTLPQTLIPLQNKQPQEKIHRSLVFNCYNYDNYQSLPMFKGKKSSPNKRKISNPYHKNIQIVFCENKLPQFVSKTNQKIEEIYKQERIIQNTQRKQALIKSQYQTVKIRQSFVKPAPKTNFANCLKQYSTLQKLSIFMEKDRNIKNKHFCHQTENDPSRNLLLDIITHRFSFLKLMNNKIRDRIYRSLLSREIHSQTKINIQEYMKIYQMFIGKDAKLYDMATFMYIFLYCNQVPTLEVAISHLQKVKGQINRLRVLCRQLQSTMERNQESLVQSFFNNEKLLRLFIDYIIQR